MNKIIFFKAMKKTFIFSALFIILSALILFSHLFGHPVWGEKIILTQPNGIKIVGYIYGDEFHRRIETEEGYTIILNEQTGIIEYAILENNKLVPSGMVVGVVKPFYLEQTNFPKHLTDRKFRIAEIRQKSPEKFHNRLQKRPKKQGLKIQALEGTKKVFVVCVGFQPEDSPPTEWSSGTYSPSGFDERLFSTDTSDISMTNYYKSNSYNKFWPEGYTYPDWVTLPQTASWYKEKDSWRQIITDALDEVRNIDPSFDFTQHANSGDMDLILVWAGRSENWGDFYWPHRSLAMINRYGVRVKNYNAVEERNNDGSENDDISVFCHEYGHMTGSPDLYDYSSFHLVPIGYYCVMGAGDRYSNFCGYLKWRVYGWVIPEEVFSSGTYNVDALGLSSASNPRLYKINIESPEEFLLLENRHDGSDPDYENLSGRRSGLLITHIDENYLPAEGLPYYTFYGVEAIIAGLDPSITTLEEHAAYYDEMVFASDYGYTRLEPAYPDDQPAGAYLTLTSGDDTENVIYRNTQGHTKSTSIYLDDISSSQETMSFSATVPPMTPAISGSVKTPAGQAIEGVTLSFSDGGGETTTDEDGNYVHDVPLDWSGTVTPSNTGLIFDPPSRDYSNVTSSQIEQDYFASSSFLKGKVTNSASAGIEDVQVRVYSSSDSYVTSVYTDSNGDYIIGGLEIGGYKLRFDTYYASGMYGTEYYNDKDSRGAADLVSVTEGSTTSGIDAVLAEGGNIAGRVSDIFGVGIEDVYIYAYTPSGGYVTFDYTDSNGDYGIKSLKPGSYKLEFYAEFALGDYLSEWYNDKDSFSTSDSVSVTEWIITSGIDAELSGENPIISGIVKTSADIGIEGVTIAFSDDGGTITTDSDGNYFNTVSYGWSGTATPSKEGYTFFPPSRTYTTLISDQTNEDYVGTVTITTPTISGNVKTSDGTGLEGVTITFSNEGGTATTDSDGNYSHSVSDGWSGTAAPSLLGYIFEPSSIEYTDVTSDQTGQNYTATYMTYTISGTVTVDGSGFEGVLMNGLPGYPATDASGSYSATVGHGWSGTVTPTKAGYTFLPSGRRYENVASNKTGQDYTATAITSEISWTSAGLSGEYINDLAIDPTSSNTVWAAVVGGHLAKTTDGGNSWDFLTNLPIGIYAVAIDPQNPSTIYFGDSSSFYRGGTWGWQKTLYSGTQATDIWVNPSNSDIILLATTSPWTRDYGVWRSYKGAGMDCTRVIFTRCLTLASHPNDDNTIYAGTKDNGAILRSTDGGKIDTWQLFSPGGYWVDEVRDIEVDSNSNLYAATSNGLWRGDGSSWTELSWTPQTSGTSNHLNSVYFADANTGWAVGWDGTIIKTTDGGNIWVPQTSGTGNHLYSVHFTDSDAGWAVGVSGTILNTTDGGTNWAYQTSGTSNPLFSVYFTNANTGWVVGGWDGTILKTTDGGETWEPQTSGTSNSLRSVHFTDSNTGWVVGYSGTILKTADGGTNWAYQTSGTSNHLFSVYFTDANTGWAVGDSGTILNTTDGGDSWTPQTSGTEKDLSSVYFTDSDAGWAVGWDGTILNTTDGGETWEPQSSRTSNWLDSVYFSDSNTGWAVGWDGTIIKTTDGGNSWTPSFGATNNINFLSIDRSTSPGVLYGGTFGEGVFVSKDGGDTWIEFNDGLGNLNITKLAISNTQPKMLYAGTADGMWSRSIQQYTLSITSGTGGTTDPALGACIYFAGTEVSINALPDTGYTFSHWTGDVPSGHENANPLIITMDSDKSVTANFSSTIPQIIISGAVKTSGGEGVEGVTISFSNEGGTATTDSDGNYSHSVSSGWSGTATLSVLGYIFDPSSIEYTDVTSDQTGQNYTATYMTYTISGTVTVDSSGLEGVLVNGLPGDPATDASGNYSATVEHGWSGTVIPSKAGHSFSPSSRSYSNMISDETSQDYVATVIDTGISWTTGGPYGGYIKSLAISETNPEIIYAGTGGAHLGLVDIPHTGVGVYKSEDAGKTWTKTGFPKIEVFAVVVNPTDPDVVYAGTNEDGIYKSEDGGSTWTQKGLSDKTISTIAIDPKNAKILYAGTSEFVPYEDYINSIYKSTDGGETWKGKVTYGYFNIIIIDPDDSLYVYAGCNESYGFLKSTDGGENWAASNITTVFPERVYALAKPPAGYNPQLIYAVAKRALYKSTDRGENWTKVECPHASMGDGKTLAIDSKSPNKIYVGTESEEKPLYLYDDDVDTWYYVGEGLPSGPPSSLVINSQDTKILYLGFSEGGLYKYTNEEGTNTWNHQSISNSHITDLDIHPTSSDTVFAGVKGLNFPLVKTTNGGTSWDYLVDSLTNIGSFAIDPQNPSTIYVGKGWHYFPSHIYIYKSTDDGENWTDIDVAMVTTDDYRTRISDILIDENNSDYIMVAAAQELWKEYLLGVGLLARTTDGGATWDELLTFHSSTALAADPNNPDVIYSGKIRPGQIFQFTDVWGSWAVDEITPPEGIGDVQDIEVDMNSHVYVATNSGLMKWDGYAWTELTGLPTEDFTALAIDRATNPGIIYAGTRENGVFVSQDGGSTWIAFNDGLENLNITKLAISKTQPKMLYAGTAYGGAWSRNIVNQYTLTISAGTGGTTDPEPETYSYAIGAEVSITATPDTGYEFAEWTGDVPYGQENANPLIITMDSDKSVTANFSSTIPQVIISGAVKTSGDGGVEGVTITFSNEGGSTTTDSSGNYSSSVNEGWSGTVTPSKTGYTFSPGSRSYTDVTYDQAGQDYTATLLTYTISGMVSRGEALGKMKVAGGPRSEINSEFPQNRQTDKMSVSSSSGSMVTQSGLSGVVMNGLLGNPTTDDSGNYSAIVDYGWSGTVTPTKAGCTFSPSSSTYTNVTSDHTGEDYTATVLTYTISGKVSTGEDSSSRMIQATGGLSGVEMDGLPGNPTTDASGNYSAAVDYGFSGTVTPTKAGYSFSPPSETYANVTSDQQNQNYSASIFRPTLTIVCGDGGMTTPSPGTYVYDYGTEVLITATPDSGCRCAGWTGDVPSGHENDNPVTITMDSDKTITANFIRQYTLTIVAGTGGTTSPAPGSHSCDSGTQVSVTAVPSSGYQFSGWSGDALGTTNPITITMDSDKTITATFIVIPPAETGDGDGGGGGGCFIATAAYGSPLHPHLDILRDFRDKYLMPNGFGRKLVELYYRYSPSIAGFIARHKLLKAAVRINLLPWVALSYLAIHFSPAANAAVLIFMLVFPILFLRFYPRGRILE